MKNRRQKKVVHYDQESDIFYIGMKGEEEEYVEVAPGVGVELDANGAVIGIEILNASEVLKPIAQTFLKKAAVA
ncbi:MAG: hypothetical protein A3B34_03625 [Candidatus Sungbacteria bacterium RIFCSPLOWO2_01_FULL_54_21]|uniref:DUF2283 domain-containing protein n=1 Tax=Candidatus Sungbacteria bacterium RIFCSPLOWO2_01_FULL_54_21 TaxID=1802279 RepID=A0A1G2L7F3_9BACT|nr:MAG: hypothetical protein A2679_03320 [Candidatus Sungbacteria bacterium RIFCSPHIGHO2_01_FULL_54_26]OHA07474.1 MAG: hypothetical protein A3B34_03625 [Candidatus Sungbacteria bacterium RIFCSPLOWO2_01_FULL_54_21]